MKKIIIGASVIIVLCVGILIYLAVKNSTSTKPNNSGTTVSDIKPLPSPDIPKGSTISISTSKGNVTVNNFIKNAQKIIETAVYLRDNDKYSIIYFSNSNQFLIDLKAYDGTTAGTYREQAENDLVTTLSISESDACKLPVDLEVASTYNSNLANTNYKLSFCPDGIQIPVADSSSNSTSSTQPRLR